MKRFVSPRTKAGRWPVAGIFVLLMIFAASVPGAPVTAEQAARVATNYIVKRYPPTAKAATLTITSTGRSRLAVQSVQPWVESGQTIGYVAHLNPSGYALFSADDEAPPIKLYSDRGSFWNLPPKFLRVIGLELAEDLAVLDTMRLTLTPVEPKYNQQWSALVEPQFHPLGLKEVAGEAEGTVLTQTTWNQDYPYNCKCPDGPPCDGTAGGGRAWAGCTACATAQILRYWKEPYVISMDHTNTDPGACHGTHSISEGGMGPYDWGNMPNSIDNNSPNSEKGAIGQLMFHAAIALNSDFGAESTSANATLVPGVLSNYFAYTCRSLEEHETNPAPQWYDKIVTDIDAHRPVFYAMWEYDKDHDPPWYDGHSVVCDGYRNGNEIHLNLGWSGHYNDWYNIDRVECNGNDWTSHSAVFSITPEALHVDGSYTNSDTVPFKTVKQACEAVLGHTTIIIQAGDYSETLIATHPALLKGTNGIVRIGSP
jgi:hypothetical protein